MNYCNRHHLPVRGFAATDNRQARGPRGWLPPIPPQLNPVGHSQEGITIFDRPSSHHHLTPELLDAALGRIAVAGRPFVKERVDFGRVIGMTDCVPTTAKDRISFARRDGRAGLTRFVHSREPETCTSVIIILKRMGGDEGYLLVTAFVGTAAEPEPWDRNATSAAFDYWSDHALVWGSCPVVPGTETTHCPWDAVATRPPAPRGIEAACPANPPPVEVCHPFQKPSPAPQSHQTQHTAP